MLLDRVHKLRDLAETLNPNKTNVELTCLERKILQTLIMADGNIVPFNQIVSTVHIDGRARTTRGSLHVAMVSLRKKLQDYDVNVETKYKEGYFLNKEQKSKLLSLGATV